MAIIPNQHRAAYEASRQSLENLRRLVKRIKAKAWAAGVRRTLLEYGAIVLAALFLTVALTPLFYWQYRIYPVFAALTIGSMVCYWAFRGLRVVFRKESDDRAALRLEKARPDLNDRLINAIQLGRDLENPEPNSIISPELTAMAIQDADRFLQGAAIRNVVSPIAARRAKKYFLCLALINSIVFVAFYKDATEAVRVALTDPYSYQDSIGGFRLGSANVAPEVGDLEVSYRFPKYTKREPAADPNHSGDLFALKGSTATIKARTNKRVKRAELVVNETQRLPMKIRGRSIEGDLDILEDGSYRIEVEDHNGRLNENGYERSIIVEQDAPPVANLIAPAESMEIANDVKLQITYAGSDDYGITRAELVYQVLDTPERIVLAEFKNEPSEVEENALWDLSEQNFQPGDVVSFYIELFDNDGVSGQKAGSTEILYLQIQDENDIHFELTNLKEALMEEYLLHLADLLENPLPENGRIAAEYAAALARLSEPRRKEILTQIAELIGKMKEDPLGQEEDLMAIQAIQEKTQKIFGKRTAFDGLQSAGGSESLTGAAAQNLKSLLAEEIDVAETSLTYLDKAVKRERLEEVLAEGDRIDDLKEELLSLISELKDGNLSDDEVRKIMAKLAKLQSRLNELLANAMKSMASIPEGYANPDAQEKMDDAFSLSDIDQIRKELSLGNIEKALQMAQQMFESLDNLMNQFQDMSEEVAPSMPFMDEMMTAGQDMMREISDLSEEQGKLLDDTQKLTRELTEKAASEDPEGMASLRNELDELAGKMAKDLENLRSGTMNYPTAEGLELAGDVAGMETKLGELREQLDKDLFSSLERAQSLQEEMDAFQKASEKARGEKEPTKEQFGEMESRSQDFREKNEDLMGRLQMKIDSIRDGMASDSKEKMDSLAGRQNELRDRTNKLAQKGKSQFDPSGMPMPMPESMRNSLDGAMRSLQQAGQQMAMAGDKLGKSQPGQAVPSERAAMESLKNGSKQCQNAMQGGSGRPMPGGQQPQWAQNRIRKKGGQMGRSNEHNEKIVIPPAEAFKGPEKYRQDILEALKEKYPEQYEKHIKDYYKSIAK